MTEEELKEKIAALEHYQWSHWFLYQLDNSSNENVDRWLKQANTPYKKLSENEKNSDREWADEVLKIIRDAGYKSPEEVQQRYEMGYYHGLLKIKEIEGQPLSTKRREDD